MKFCRRCGGVLLAAMSGVSFSKKDFADTIKDPCTYMQMEGRFEETPMTFRSPDGAEKRVTIKRTY